MGLLILGCILSSSPLLVGEALTRLLSLKDEYARKTVHVLGGLTTTLLVLFLSLSQIAFLGGFYCLLLLFIRQFWHLKSLYQVNRRSFGEIFFPAGVCATALLASNKEFFVYAILIMGIADTAASLVGNYKAIKLKRFINSKSLQGSLAFALITILILGVSDFSTFQISLIAVTLTAVEFVSPIGSDNITVPTIAVLLLNYL